MGPNLSPRHAIFTVNSRGIEEANYGITVARGINIRLPNAIVRVLTLGTAAT
jgi:hypothetical protein